MSVDPTGLMAALALAPNLPGARCAGRHKLFDATIEGTRTGPDIEVAQARAEALRLCAGCPELGPCGRWLAALPKSQRPAGVVAGQLLGVRVQKRRPKPSITPKGIPA